MSTTPKLTESQLERLRDIHKGDQPTWDEASFFENAGLIRYEDNGDRNEADNYKVTKSGLALLAEESKS